MTATRPKLVLAITAHAVEVWARPRGLKPPDVRHVLPEPTLDPRTVPGNCPECGWELDLQPGDRVVKHDRDSLGYMVDCEARGRIYFGPGLLSPPRVWDPERRQYVEVPEPINPLIPPEST